MSGNNEDLSGLPITSALAAKLSALSAKADASPTLTAQLDAITDAITALEARGNRLVEGIHQAAQLGRISPDERGEIGVD